MKDEQHPISHNGLGMPQTNYFFSVPQRVDLALLRLARMLQLNDNTQVYTLGLKLSLLPQSLLREEGPFYQHCIALIKKQLSQETALQRDRLELFEQAYSKTFSLFTVMMPVAHALKLVDTQDTLALAKRFSNIPRDFLCEGSPFIEYIIHQIRQNPTLVEGLTNDQLHLFDVVYDNAIHHFSTGDNFKVAGHNGFSF